MEILIKDIINQGKLVLEKAGVTDAVTDSWLLAEFVFGITKSGFYINPDVKTDSEKADRYMELINKRADKIPLQHITGIQEFMGFDFKVNENVLIPRQDTELLVENAVEYINSLNRKVKVLDMCTGSGCIAISVDKMCPLAEVTAVDISDKALEVARENGRSNDADVEFIQSDLFENISDKFDVIISNPPYIETAVVETLMEEVREHEPMLALDGDADGLKFYRIISEKAKDYLGEGGIIMYEIGYDQGVTVPEILEENKFKDIKVYKDLSGNDRVVIARKE